MFLHHLLYLLSHPQIGNNTIVVRATNRYGCRRRRLASALIARNKALVSRKTEQSLWIRRVSHGHCGFCRPSSEPSRCRCGFITWKCAADSGAPGRRATSSRASIAASSSFSWVGWGGPPAGWGRGKMWMERRKKKCRDWYVGLTVRWKNLIKMQLEWKINLTL